MFTIKLDKYETASLTAAKKDGALFVTTEDRMTNSFSREVDIPKGTVLLSVFGNIMAFLPSKSGGYAYRFWSKDTFDTKPEAAVHELKVRKMLPEESITFQGEK